MKNIIITLIILTSFALNSFAQIDRSKAPEAGPAPKIQIGDYKSFELDNGLKVFVVENHKFPTVSYSLTFDIDPVLEEKQAGYVSVTGNLLRAGTKNRTKQQIDEEIDFIAANLNTYSKGIYASSLKKHSDKLLDLMSDVLFNPIFPEAELEKQKKQMKSSLAASKNNASAIINNVVNKVVYGDNHPYGEVVSEESVDAIKIDKCKEYYNTYFKPNIAYLVIVGDITINEAKKQTEKYFGKWKKAEVPQHKYSLPIEPKGNKVAYVVKEDAVQSTINIVFPVQLKPSDKDVIKVKLMNEILGGGIFSGRLNMNLREDKGFTYGARSNLKPDPVIGSFVASAEIKGEATDSAVHEFLYEIKRMINEKVDDEQMQLSKNVSTGIFALRLERPQTIANFALNIARYGLATDYYKTYLEKLNAVTKEEVQQMAKKYLKPENCYIVVVGPKNEAEKLKKFSGDNQIHYYDFYGNPAKNVKTRKIEGDITAQQVIEKYIKAVGGEEKWGKIENLTMEMTSEMNGMELKFNIYRKKPNKYATELNMNGMILQRQIYNGEKAFMVAQGQNKELKGDDLNEIKLQAKMLVENQYEELGFKTKLLGIEEIDGTDAYKMEIKTPNGTTRTDYFCTKSGLRLKSITKKGDIIATSYFKDYKEVDGIKVPGIFIQSSGGRDLKMEVKNVDIKSKIEDNKFNL